MLPQGDKVNEILDFMGCTANICYIENKSGKVYCANLGDSKAMHFQSVGKTSQIEQLNTIHCINDPIEQSRILAAGCLIDKNTKVSRVINPLDPTCGINVTRSVGDFMFKVNMRNFEDKSS